MPDDEKNSFYFSCFLWCFVDLARIILGFIIPCNEEIAGCFFVFFDGMTNMLIPDKGLTNWRVGVMIRYCNF